MDNDHFQRREVFHWIVRGSLVVAIAYAVIEHWQHLSGALPYLLLLACPLMHLFGHHGHHRHSDKQGEPDSASHGEGRGHDLRPS